MTNDLPTGWATTTLGELFAPRKGKYTPNSTDPRAYLSLDSVESHTSRIAAWERSSDYSSQSSQLCAGDVAYARLRPYLNKVALIDREALGSAEFIVLPEIPQVLPSFLRYRLISHDFVRFAAHHSTGDRPRLKWAQMRDFTLGLPPIAEQERIVAAIEEHFSRLDAAASALSAAQRRLDALLQSALRSLCDGSWTQLPLRHIIKSLKNGVFVSRPSATPPGYPIYRISAVRPLVLRIDDVRYANPVPNGAISYAVEAGDILFTRYSGNPDYVGAAAVVPEEGAGVLHPDKLIRVVADRDVALPEWIAAYVAAGTGRREVEKRLKTTAGQVGISGSQLGSVPIAVPPISYQQQATDRIGNVLAEQTRIRQILSSTETTVGALRRSILSVAFSGQLVPQDPTDEPAPVLLERVTASRTTKPTAG